MRHQTDERTTRPVADRPATAVDAHPATPSDPHRRNLRRLAVAATVAGLVGLSMLVITEWPPLAALDATILAVANDLVAPSPSAVAVLQLLTDLGSAGVGIVVYGTAVAALLLRGAPRLAGYLVVAGLGALVFDEGIKALVGRARPVVDVAVAAAPGFSFPSGHTLGTTITCGALLLVFLPAVPRRFHKAAVAIAIAVAVVVGLTRVLLGVHYPTDVVAGWALGVCWVALTALAFRVRWPQPEGTGVLTGGLAPTAGRDVQPAPAGDRPLPRGALDLASLVVAAVLVWGALILFGELLSAPRGVVLRIDATVVDALVEIRGPVLTQVASAAGRLGGTVGIVTALVVITTLALALTRRWRPAVFLVAAVVGETAIFTATATIVERSRPEVVMLTPNLPPTASFPSGHAAAAMALYGAAALLVMAWRGGWLGRLALAGALVVGASVALSRLYRGVHYPTDILGSAVLACAWLWICWTVLRPGRPDDVRSLDQ